LRRQHLDRDITPELEDLPGAATRPTIVETFDRGASLLSYIGHGAIRLDFKALAAELSLSWRHPRRHRSSQRTCFRTCSSGDACQDLGGRAAGPVRPRGAADPPEPARGRNPGEAQAGGGWRKVGLARADPSPRRDQGSLVIDAIASVDLDYSTQIASPKLVFGLVMLQDHGIQNCELRLVRRICGSWSGRDGCNDLT